MDGGDSRACYIHALKFSARRHRAAWARCDGSSGAGARIALLAHSLLRLPSNRASWRSPLAVWTFIQMVRQPLATYSGRADTCAAYRTQWRSTPAALRHRRRILCTALLPAGLGVIVRPAVALTQTRRHNDYRHLFLNLRSARLLFTAARIFFYLLVADVMSLYTGILQPRASRHLSRVPSHSPNTTSSERLSRIA